MNSKQRKSLPAHARPPKAPVLHRRGQSYNNALSQSHSSNAKLAYAGNKRSSVEVLYQEEDEDQSGMSNFCTTCEKQIVTPSGASILYCSEACRKKDVSRPASVQSFGLSPVATTPSAGYFDTPPLDIVPKRSPTAARPMSLALSDLNLSSESESIFGGAESQHSNDSEAARYLSQFYAEHQVVDRAATRRPKTSRTSTAGESGIPSLSHTPSSSFGTAASGASYRQQGSERAGNPSQGGPESADVVRYPSCGLPSIGEHVKAASVTSSASTLTSLQTVERADVSFDRRDVMHMRQRQSSGGLKQLLSHEA